MVEYSQRGTNTMKNFRVTFTNAGSATYGTSCPRFWFSRQKLKTGFTNYTPELLVPIITARYNIRIGFGFALLVEASTIHKTTINTKITATNVVSGYYGLTSFKNTITYPMVLPKVLPNSPTLTGMNPDNAMEKMKQAITLDLALQGAKTLFNLTDDEINTIKPKTCMVFIVASRYNLSNIGLVTDVISESGAGGIWCPFVSEKDFLDFEFIGEYQPKYVLYKPNAYALNVGAKEGSVCVAELKVKFPYLNRNDYEDLNTTPCPGTAMITDFDRFTFELPSIIANPSEYVRKDFEGEQRIYTPLDFKGDTKINLGNIANKSYADKKLDLAKLSLVDFGRL